MGTYSLSETVDLSLPGSVAFRITSLEGTANAHYQIRDKFPVPADCLVPVNR